MKNDLKKLVPEWMAAEAGDAQIIVNHGMRKNKLGNKINGCLAILNF